MEETTENRTREMVTHTERTLIKALEKADELLESVTDTNGLVLLISSMESAWRTYERVLLINGE